MKHHMNCLLLHKNCIGRKFKTYLWHNANKQNDPLVIQARKKHFDWISVDDPHRYKYHCEKKGCDAEHRSFVTNEINTLFFLHRTISQFRRNAASHRFLVKPG